MPTCENEEDVAKRDPSFLLVSPEIVKDVFWVERPQDANIILDQVKEPDSSDQKQPQQDDWCERVADFVSSKSLDGEENYQNCDGDPYNLICVKFEKKSCQC